MKMSPMKSTIYSCLAVVALGLLVFAACKKDNVNAPITDIYFGWSPEDAEIQAAYKIGSDGVFVGVNNTKSTSVIQEPRTAYWALVHYTSLDTNVVRVAADGLLTGVGKGVTKVRAFIYDKEDSTKVLEDFLKVYVDTIPVTNIDLVLKSNSFDTYSEKRKTSDGKADSTFRENPDTLFWKDYVVMTASCTPVDASFMEMEWTTDREDLFTIHGDTIFATGEGKVTDWATYPGPGIADAGMIVGRLKQNNHSGMVLTVNGEPITDDTEFVFDWKISPRKLDYVMWSSGKHKMTAGSNENLDKLITFVPAYASYRDVTFYSEHPDTFAIVGHTVYSQTSHAKGTKVAVTSVDQMNSAGTALLSDTCKFLIR